MAVADGSRWSTNRLLRRAATSLVSRRGSCSVAVVGSGLGGCGSRGVSRVVPGSEADVVALELQGACEVDGVVTAQGVLRRRTSLVPVDAGQTSALLLARSLLASPGTAGPRAAQHWPPTRSRAGRRCSST